MRAGRALRASALLAGIAALAPAVAPAADADLVSGLVRNAWYWQARSREDKAEEAWRQVLAADPANADALGALGGFDARAGRVDEARRKLERLEKAAPRHPDVPVLRREIQVGPRFAAQLADARRSVHEGRVGEGVSRYRALFGDAGPPGDLALEYYQTVGGTGGGWEEARDGLRRLTRRAPGEARFELALAKLLTWRDATRREGIGILSRLARSPEVARDAVASWRQALLWLGSAPEDVQLLRAYARTHPEDGEIARRVEQDRRAGVVRSGFAALDRGDLAEAERLFRGAGAAPDARLGLALVAQRRGIAAQRRQELGQARELLERAKRLAPDRPDLWEESLRSVTFWQLVEGARADRARGRNEAAESGLLAALDRAPEADRWHADLALAELYLATGRSRDAEGEYREVLAAQPDQPDALRGLAGILVDARRFDEAIPFNERLVRIERSRAFRTEWLVAEDLRARAARFRKDGDVRRARAELEAARRADPGNAWVLHDLGGLLLEQGAVAEARSAIAALLRAAPSLPEAHVLDARLLAAEGQSAKALEVLDALEQAPADPSVVALRRRLDVDVRLPPILEAAASGRRAAAEQSLLALQRRVEDAPELAARVAVAWAKLGAYDRAVALMRAAMARAPRATREARLELASALLDAGEDAAVFSLIDGLERDASLSADERRWLGSLRIAYAIRAADRSRARGDPRPGFTALDPVLREYPGDPRLLAALGRLLEASGEARRAHAVYLAVLARAPEDGDARRGAADTALAMGDLDEAQRLADEGMRLAPVDPRPYLLAGRIAARRGDDAAAMRSLERARDVADAAAPLRGETASASAPPAEGSPRRAALDVPADPDPAIAVRGEIFREMDRVRDRHKASVAGAGEARRRSGEPGLSSLLELGWSVGADLPIAYRGRARAEVRQVTLDAGAVERDAVSRFGTGGGSPGVQRATGTELRASYEDRNLALNIGSSPLGFPVYYVVGGAGLRLALGDFHVGVEGARKVVDDSIVSYAGVQDPATKHWWGGVAAEGGRLEMSWSPRGATIWAQGSVDRLVGFHVAENRRLAAGLGARFTASVGPAGELGAGVTAIGLAFDNDQNFFTYGHGGYFSPERFLHAGLPVAWTRRGRLHWDVVAEPGWHSFVEASAPVFPIGPPPGATAGTAAGGISMYPRHATQGFAFDGRALLGYTLVGTFDASVQVSYREGPEFRETRGTVALRLSPW